MVTRPALSFNVSDLQRVKKVKESSPSSHSVEVVTFKDPTIDGPIHAYKKLCDENYPPLLAKYVVAFSVLVRAALGERASEDRLIYNDTGQIIGSVSIEVPNFVPLLKAGKTYDDPKKNELGNPNKETLIKYNVAELLVSAYKHKNNDLHPDNISVNGLIDWDELYYEITSIIKGQRVLSGIAFETPKVSTQAREKDLRSFPNVGARIHWPTNFVPKNWNLLKMYKTGAFLELQGDSEFTDQYFTAILKELLAFDKKMLTQRMKLYLGNEELNLNELPIDKRVALLSFGRESKLFLDEQGKERKFVEHCIMFLEQEHIKFKNILLNMPEFHDFLIKSNKDPAKIVEIKKWFINQNEKNIIPYNLNFIDTELHTLWRECFKQKFADHMKQFDIDITQRTKLYLTNKNVSDDKNPCPKTPLIRQATQGHELTYEKLGEMITSLIHRDESDESKPSMIHNHTINDKETLLLNNEISLKIKKQGTQLYEKISQLIREYQEIPDATIHDNHAFINNVKTMIKINRDERKKLETWLQDYKSKSTIRKEIEFLLNPHIYHMTALFSDIEEFIKNLEVTLDAFRMNHTMTYVSAPADKLKTSQSRIHLAKLEDEKKPLSLSQTKPLNQDDNYFVTETTIIPHLCDYLKNWVTPEKNPHIKNLISEAHKEYYAKRSESKLISTFYYLSGKTVRGKETCQMSLPEIFSVPDSGWEYNSLNTLIIKKLCITLLKHEKQDPYKTIYEILIKKGDSWWGTVALKIAEKSDLKPSLQPIHEKANVHSA